MKTRIITRGLLIAGLIMCGINLAVAQPADSAKGDMASMMEQMAQFAAPGEQHKLFAAMVGTWDATVTMWMEPGAPPMTSTGVGTYSLILGGRYLKHDFEGFAFGQPFKGLGITGYDKFREEYFDLWFDELSTGVMISRGVPDSTGAIIRYTGKMDDPMAGRKDVPVRSDMTKVDDDTCKMEMYVIDESGNEFKTMEIVYTRRK